jgi:hypothetical protein
MKSSEIKENGDLLRLHFAFLIVLYKKIAQNLPGAAKDKFFR